MRYLIVIFLAIILAASSWITKTVAFAEDSEVFLTNVNIDVYSADTRDVLFALADVGGVNMVIDDSVTGTVTLKLKDVSFKTALDLITKVKGLTYYQQEDIIVVADSNQIAGSFGEIYFFQLKYADATEIISELTLIFDDKKPEKKVQPKDLPAEIQITTDLKSAIISNNFNTRSLSANSNSVVKNKEKIDIPRFRFDEATNMIIFKGTAPEAQQIRRLLAELDVPYKQITLEAQVVALTKESSKSLGIEWSWEDTPQVIGATTDVPNKGSIAYGRNPSGLSYQFYYQARINALVSSGNAKVLAKPKITTLNGRRARILIGERIPVLVEKNNYGNVTTTIEYIDTGINLTFLPNINTDSSITATVHTEVSSPSLVPEMRAYRITTREASTIVRMQNGETMVIGGLIGAVDNQTKKSIPFLSSLPILGHLFKSTTSSKTDTEVIIFLTATVVE